MRCALLGQIKLKAEVDCVWILIEFIGRCCAEIEMIAHIQPAYTVYYYADDDGQPCRHRIRCKQWHTEFSSSQCQFKTVPAIRRICDRCLARGTASARYLSNTAVFIYLVRRWLWRGINGLSVQPMAHTVAAYLAMHIVFYIIYLQEKNSLSVTK